MHYLCVCLFLRENFNVHLQTSLCKDVGPLIKKCKNNKMNSLAIIIIVDLSQDEWNIISVIYQVLVGKLKVNK